jgi:hypothetical protein
VPFITIANSSCLDVEVISDTKVTCTVGFVSYFFHCGFLFLTRLCSFVLSSLFSLLSTLYSLLSTLFSLSSLSSSSLVATDCGRY